MTERIRLGELLVETGLISREQLERALRLQCEDKRRLGEILVSSGILTESKVTQVLSQQLSIPWVSLSYIDFSRTLLDLVPAACAQKYGVVPIYVRRGKNRSQTLYVAMQDPTETQALEEIERFSGLPVRPMIAPPTDIQNAIRVYYLGLAPEVAPAPSSSVPLPPSSSGQAPPRPAPPPPEARAALVQALESDPVKSRDVSMPRPPAKTQRKMVTVTLLDGTQITLPAVKSKKQEAPEPHDEEGLTARDLVEALRARAGGADVSEVLGEDVSWEKLFATLLSLLLKKHLVHDWEFTAELKR